MTSNDAQNISPTLQKLRDKEAKLRQQIKDEERKEAMKLQKAHNHKCTLIGAAILEELEDNPVVSSQINVILEKRIKNNKDRKILSLPDIKETMTTPEKI